MLNSLGGGATEKMVILQSRIGHLRSTAKCFWVLAIMGVVVSSFFLGVCAQSSDEKRSHSPASLSPYVPLQAQTQPVNVSIAQIDPSKFPIIELYALVTDQDGNSISGLTAGNFLVTEQSNLETTKTIETVSVAPVTTTGSIAVALVIDRSGSMSGSKIADAKTGANSFIDNLATLDRAAIISFSSYVTVNQAFTSDKSALHTAVNSLSAGGNTAVYDAIYRAVEEVTGELGVKAVVIFTDGQSNSDSHTVQEAIDLAKAGGVPVYTIGLGSGVNESILQTIANETGGYYTYAATASELQQIYNDIAQSIRDQYLVTYSTHNPNYDGTTRTVEATATVGANSDSGSTTYSVTQPPQINLTQDTADLMSQAQYAGQALTIGAIITDDVLVTRAKLFYRHSGSGDIYTEVEMTSSSDLYTADIPASDVVTPGVDFYVTATDGTLTSSAPQNNPATYPYQIAILPNEAPVIDHIPVTTAAESTDIPISAKVTDTTDYVDHVKLFYRTTGYVLYDSLNMLSSNDTYTATIPGAKVISAGVDYYIMASDNHTVKTYDGTDVSPHHINTANKLPVANAGPDQTITDTDGDGQEDVALDGSQSDDPDGTIASWVWTEGGTQIATGETPTITLSVGTHTITLTVTDNDSATDTDEVAIVIASGHAVNSPNEPSGPQSGEVDELLEFSTSKSTCSKGHSVEYQFNWDSSGEDDLSEWSSSTSASHSYSEEGTYQVKARARCASDTSVESGWSAAKTVIIGPPSDEHAPTADASDITGQPETMHPDTFYTVTAKYYDADGRDDLNICYLRLNHPSKRLTMMWYQVDGNYGYYAGEGGERYLTINRVHPTEIPGSPEGYELSWTFKISNDWPEVENAIDFGVFTSDDDGLNSGDWHYDDTNAPFILQETGTVTGRVTDASIPGPSNGITGAILLLHPNPFTYPPVTLNQGYFSFSAPAGTYDITGSAENYESQTKRVTVAAGEPTEVDFDLSPDTGTLLTVPYYNQSDTGWCWAASAAMLLKYYGFDVEPWDIAAALGKGPDSGIIENPVIGSSVYRYIERNFKGLCKDNWVFDFYLLSHIDPSPLKARIISLLSEDSPVRMSVWTDTLEGHDVVIVGYSDASDTVYFHDPSNALKAGRVQAGMPWQDFVDRAAPDSIRIPVFIVGRSDCLSEDGKSLTISVLPLQTGPPMLPAFTFKDGASSLNFDWDGREEYGYKYRAMGSIFPEDPLFGYATTLSSNISITAFVANAGPVAANARIKVEIFSAPSSTLVNQIAPVETGLSGRNDKEVLLLDAIPLSTFITEPGTYKLSLSIINTTTQDVSDDTCTIRFRVASETPIGQGIQESFPDGMGSITFNNVTNTGYTNIVETDTAGHETGNIQVQDRAYTIDTTATFSGNATITIHYDDSGLTSSQEKNLKMYKVVDTPWWKWWGDRIDITQSVDTTANVITGRTDSFSAFLLGYETGTIPLDNPINHGPNPVPDTGTAFFYSLPVGTSTAKLMVLSATSGRLLFETSIDVDETRFPATGTWDPVDSDGVKLANGPYLYVLIANGELIGQGKMVIQR